MKNIFAYTALGPSPAYCSINEDEHGVVIVTVRAKDGREASVEIPKTEAALLQQGEPEGWSSKTGHDKFSFRNGIRFAITWLHERAHSMNDPKAQTILNTAAFNLGTESSSAADKAMLSASPLPPAPGAETGATTDKIGGFGGTGIYKRSIAPDPITGQGDARSLDIWCIEAAKREGDAEVGAGYHSLPEAVAALSSRQAALEETLLKLCDQIESDLKSAHAEICKLQNLDPKTHTWPAWSQQSNTLHWVKKIRSEIIDDASFDDLRASGGVFATTPPAEGETE